MDGLISENISQLIAFILQYVIYYIILCTQLCTTKATRYTFKYTIVDFFLNLTLTFSASWSLSYLYTKKFPLSWSQTMYGINAGYTVGIKGLALLLINPLLKKRLGMRDTSIMIMSLVTNAFGEMLFGFSTHTWMVFIG